jgi:hypothetical protein
MGSGVVTVLIFIDFFGLREASIPDYEGAKRNPRPKLMIIILTNKINWAECYQKHDCVSSDATFEKKTRHF